MFDYEYDYEYEYEYECDYDYDYDYDSITYLFRQSNHALAPTCRRLLQISSIEC